MTKHALEAAAEVLHAELAAHNMKVNIIEPGPYSTGFNERMNQSKHKWYNENSIFSSDDTAIKELEAWLVSEQYDPAEVVDTLVAVVEDSESEFRICIPKAWEQTVREVLCGKA